MKSLKKTRRIQIIALAFVCLAGATAITGYAMRDGINFFRTPSQVVGARFIESLPGSTPLVLTRGRAWEPRSP